jgi:serine/threonine protein kinase
MTPVRWRCVREVFESALLHPPASRADFMREACHGDDDLRAEVSALLEAHTLADSVFETGHELEPGDTVEHYRILSVIGRGGIGVVYRALDTRLERQIALKVLMPHGHHGILPGLRDEAKAASGFNHVNIVTIMMWAGRATWNSLPWNY